MFCIFSRRPFTSFHSFSAKLNFSSISLNSDASLSFCSLFSNMSWESFSLSFLCSKAAFSLSCFPLFPKFTASSAFVTSMRISMRRASKSATAFFSEALFSSASITGISPNPASRSSNNAKFSVMAANPSSAVRRSA